MSNEELEIPERFTSGQITSLTESCGNLSCGFNVDGICTASGTECFGFMEVDDE